MKNTPVTIAVLLIIVGIIAVALLVVGDAIKPVEKVNMDTGSMSQSQEKENQDREFLTTMIKHHLGAVAMAREALEKSRRKEIKTFAQQIIDDQSREIATMNAWREQWFNDTAEITIDETMHAGASMTQDLGKADAQFDLRFLDAMIEHHRGAVSMAQGILATTQREELKNMANAIITAQEKEIQTMINWKLQWYQKDTPPQS